MSAPPNASTTTMVKPSPSSVLDSWSVEENVIELHPKPSHPRHHHRHHSSHHPHHRHRSRSGNSERQPSSRSSLSLDDEEEDYDSSSTTSSCSTSTSTSSYYSDDDCYDGEDDDDEIRLDDFRPLPIHLNPASPLSYAASDRVCEVVRTEDIEEARLDWYRTSEELGNDEGAGGDNDSSHPRDHHSDLNPPGDPFPNHRQPPSKEGRRHRFRKKKSTKKKLKKKKRHGSVTASDAAKRRVRKSGTKVHKRHSQYALTAGMMLGLRECVGGLDGVKEELSGVLSGGEEEEGEPYGDSNHTSNHLDASSEVGSSVLSGDDRDDSGGRRRRSLRNRDAATATARRAEADASKRWRSLHAECTKTQTYEFPPGVLNRTLSSHQIIASNASSHAFQFKAYAPLVFARIRAAYGIERQPFMHSICGSSHYYEFMSNAKSGQFFFYSHDGRYMIKTQTNEECKFLRDILPRYYDYVMSNPHTFLTHFYGMYRVKMPESGKRLHFVIMKSVFDTDKEIHKVWDLKGSTKGRRAKKGDSVHKDLDMIDEGRKLNVGVDTKKAMLDQLRKDATFLARLGIMDYSLLLGVHRRPDYDENSEDENKIGPDALLAPDEAMGGEGCAESSIEVTPDRAAARQRSQRPVPEKMRSNTPHRRSLFASKEMTSAAAAAALADVGGDGNVDDVVSRNGDSIGEGELSPFEDEEEHGLHSWPFDEACSGLLPGPCTRNPFAAAAAAAAALPRQPPSSSASSHASSALQSRTEMVYVPNPITSRSDLGIGSASFGGDGQNALAREIYYCGIIDILQHYNARKWGETVMRKAAGNTDAEISCVDPETYANRFVKFISTLLQ